jgi:phenylacetate-CoA ligase
MKPEMSGLGRRIIGNSKLGIDIGNRLYLRKISSLAPSSSAKHLGSDKLPNTRTTQWFARGQIVQYQEALLKNLIQYAYVHIPYYRELFDGLNVKPDEIETISDLEKIPILTREQAIKNYEKLINPDLIWRTHLSGGTTGHRLKWAFSREWSELFGRALWRGFGWAGLTPDKRVVSLYSRVIGEAAKDSLVIRDVFDPNTIEKDLERVRGFRPQFAYCYSSSAYFVGRYLLSRGENLPLEGVIVTSDQLFPHYRTVIEKAFNCRVFNNYGCNDGGTWGAECTDHAGFHHDFERSIIEFDKYGRLLATDLWNYAMPFIRYENGDTGSWINASCKCGREMPLFSITGRINDFLITPSGKVISPTACGALLENECFIDVRIIQYNEIDIEIQYIRNLKFNSEDCRRAASQLISALEEMRITMSEVDYIPRPPSNKQREVENRARLSLGREGLL